EDGIRDLYVTEVQTCALPIFSPAVDVESSTHGIDVTAIAIVLMPLLGWAKLRLAKRLDSNATAGEGVLNLLCAAQAAAALVALRSEERRVGKARGARWARAQW